MNFSAKPTVFSAKPTVLFVDDDTTLLAAITRTMRNEHIRVLAVESIELARAALSSDRIDVIVCDEHLPGASGSDFLAEIRKSHPSTLRMMLTGEATLGAVLQAINAGEVYRVLIKPCVNDVLVETVRQGIIHKQLMDRCRYILRMFRHQNDLLLRLERDHPGILDGEFFVEPEIVAASERSISQELMLEELNQEIERASGLHKAIPAPDSGKKDGGRDDKKNGGKTGGKSGGA